MAAFKFVLFTQLIGLLGWFAWHSLFASLPSEHENSCEQFGTLIRKSFLIFLCGFAFVSTTLFFLALLGQFHLKIFLVLSLFLFFCYLFKSTQLKRRHSFLRIPWHYLAFVLLISTISLCLGMIARPYQAILDSADASIYLGNAYHLANSGNLKYSDSLVEEMNPQERDILFRNRFRGDTTGQSARFPGGVSLVDPSTSTVTFSFYHLFPVWLGMGIKVLGDAGFLNLLSLFGALSLIALYFLGEDIGGRAFGFSLPFVQLFFYPQLYFVSFPFSEILAQALFLSGLWVFVSPLSSHTSLPTAHQCLLGTLWGSLFLCRIDAIMFVFIPLILSFSLIPALRKTLPKWNPLFLLLLFFSVLTFFHQLAGGTYLQLIAAVLFVHTSQISTLSSFVINHELLGFFLLVGIPTAIFVFPQIRRAPKGWAVLSWSGKTIALIISGAALAFFGLKFNRTSVAEHLSWITVYLPWWLLGGLFVGTILSACQLGIKNKTNSLLIISIFFAVPALCFVIDPMANAAQPWVMRRLVPMVFPLFFLLSLAGWHDLLRRLGGISHRLSTPIYWVLVLSISIYFLHGSAYLLRESLFANLISQVKELAEEIPQDALVVIPDSNAHYHMQIPLRYMIGRDSIVLPFNNVPSSDFDQIMCAYLHRQLDKGRPVVLLLSQFTESGVNSLAQHFALKFRDAKNIAFDYVPWVNVHTFPDRTQHFSIDYLMFDLATQKSLPLLSEINIGDPKEDIPFLVQGFYHPEGDSAGDRFRWTNPVAKLVLPPTRTVGLLVGTYRPPEAEPCSFQVSSNGSHLGSYHAMPTGKHLIVVAIPQELYSGDSWMELVLTSNAFCPKSLGLSEDSRELGIQLFQVIPQAAHQNAFGESPRTGG